MVTIVAFCKNYTKTCVGEVSYHQKEANNEKVILKQIVIKYDIKKTKRKKIQPWLVANSPIRHL